MSYLEVPDNLIILPVITDRGNNNISSSYVNLDLVDSTQLRRK